MRAVKLHPASILLGLVPGLALGAFAGWERAMPEPVVTATAAVDAAPSAATPPTGDEPQAIYPGWPRASYAQNGEDLIALSIFAALKIDKPSYIDIGAYHPVVSNNTYLLYQSGGRGVLVEPNPSLTRLLRSLRPGDRVLPYGVGLGEDTTADYYVFNGAGQENTFSKDQADALVKEMGPSVLKAVVKMPLRNINHILDEEFPSGGPDFFSIDIEGMDLDVLKTLDWKRHRPKVFCVETTAASVEHAGAQITALLDQQGYDVRGGNLVNTFFVDRKLLPR